MHEDVTGGRENRLAGQCREIGAWLFAVLLGGCALTGGGHYLAAGPITPRLILGGLILLVSVPVFWADRKEQLKNPLNWLTLLLVVWLAVCAFRGFSASNNRDVLLSDIKGFAWLFLVPCAPVLIRDRKAVQRCVNALIIGALAQAVLCIGFSLYLHATVDLWKVTFSEEQVITNVEYLNNWLHEVQWGAVDYGLWNAFRVFGNSSVYLAAASCLVLYRLLTGRKFSVLYAVCYFLLIWAMMMTVARALFGAWALGTVLTLAAVLIFRPDCRKGFWPKTLGLFAGCFVTLEILELIFVQGWLEFAVARSFHYDMYPFSVLRLIKGGGWSEDISRVSEASDGLRALTKKGLGDLIRRNPLFGNGLGATSPLRDEADEYFYLDLLARTGITGLILYLLPIAYAARQLLRNKAEALKKYPLLAVLWAMLILFLTVTYFNPWMNAVLGIAFLAFVLAASGTPARETKEL